jgi:hypothetical protein
MTASVICPYCGSKAIFTSSTRVYRGRDYGMIYLCPNYPACDSYVGVHKGTNIPLGRMANKELRLWKNRAHAVFDPLWQMKLAKRRAEHGQYPKCRARGSGYKWLAGQLGIPVEKCHIAMFDVELCKRVVEVCRPYYRQQTGKDAA